MLQIVEAAWRSSGRDLQEGASCIAGHLSGEQPKTVIHARFAHGKLDHAGIGVQGQRIPSAVQFVRAGEAVVFFDGDPQRTDGECRRIVQTRKKK